MKEIITAFLFFNLSNVNAESQYSQRQMCEALNDNNTKYYCLFRLTRNNEYCEHIKDRIVKDLCQAEYDNLTAKCNYINNHDLRILCIATQ